ncbi:hypothetical protein FM107_12070 [Sphingobacterium sp. JB170]|nr:hypothetical protein FM107_12070 [Sphingobacterium sp. JB170]
MEQGYYDAIPYVDSVPAIDSNYYQQVRDTFSGEEFDYEKTNIRDINFFKNIFSRISRWLANLLPIGRYGQFSESLSYVLAAVAIALLGWIFYRVIFSDKRLLAKDKKEHEQQDEIKFIEKNLMKVDLIPYIDKAKHEGDYALAIRYLNLLNTQLLAQKDFIKWKHTKTNDEFIREIQDAEIKVEFVRNVNIFNRIWYGGAPVDGQLYEEYVRYFFNFQKKWR